MEKVKAIKAGKATITATLNSVKYKCSVTVKAAGNPYLSDAPFDAQEIMVNKLKVVIPKDWSTSMLADTDASSMLMIYPSSGSLLTGTSNISIQVQATGEAAPEYNDIEGTLKETYTKDYIIENVFTGIDADITDFEYDSCETDIGTAFIVSYNIDLGLGTSLMKQKFYCAFIDNYFVLVSVTDIGDNVEPDIYDTAEYILDSVKANK